MQIKLLKCKNYPEVLILNPDRAINFSTSATKRYVKSETEWEQDRKVKEICKVPTCLTRGQNMRMSCRHTSAGEFNILPLYVWEADSASNKSSGNSHCREMGQQGSRKNIKPDVGSGLEKDTK